MADGDGKLLMEKVQLRIVNSTKELLLPVRVTPTKSALVVGNPKFDLTADATALGNCSNARRRDWSGCAKSSAGGSATQSAAQFASRGGDLKGGDLNPLPGTQVEVDTVNKLLKNADWQATEYTCELALKDTMKQARGPRVVHIATHGFFLSDEELKAAAEAHGAQANVNEDPMLRAGLFFAGAIAFGRARRRSRAWTMES